MSRVTNRLWFRVWTHQYSQNLCKVTKNSHLQFSVFDRSQIASKNYLTVIIIYLFSALFANFINVLFRYVFMYYIAVIYIYPKLQLGSTALHECFLRVFGHCAQKNGRIFYICAN